MTHHQDDITDTMDSKLTSHQADGDKAIQDTPTLTSFIKVLTLFAALGGFLFGYDCGIISGAMILLKKEFNLTTLWQQLIVSITIGSAAIASLLGGFLNDLFGRKRVILLASVIFTVGAGIMAATPNKEVLLVGRLVVGFGVGLAATTVPVYIAESAPPHARGRLVTVNGCCIAGGTFTSGLVAGAFSYVSWGWRAMFGIAAVPAIIQFIGFLFLPESPRWLVRKGRNQAALDILHKIHSPQEAEEEYESIKRAENEQKKIEHELKGRSVVLRVLRTSAVRRALLVGCGLQLIQQFAGINTVVYYNGTIIRMSGVESDTETLWLAAAVSSCSLIGNLISLFLVSKVGRRTLALGSLAGLTVCLVFIGMAFWLISITAPNVAFENPYAGACAEYSSCSKCILKENCGFCYLKEDGSYVNNTGACLPVDKNDITHSTVGMCSKGNKTSDTVWGYDFCPSSFGYMALVGMVAYLLIFGQGMGPMPWLINTEIYPTWARSFCNGCATATNWICNLVISMTFLSLTEAITRYGTFLLYAGIAVLGFIFLFTLLPETKDKPLEEIIHLFTRPVCTCSGEHSVAYEKLNSSDEGDPLLKDGDRENLTKPKRPLVTL